MKKRSISLAALAISASTSSMALIAPPTDTKTYCLDVYTNASGGSFAGSCDQTDNNAETGAQVGGNGCAADQIALKTARWNSTQPFPIQIYPCMPPNTVQL
ncbi:MAG TPA: hypothetical protein VEL47_01460 [Myxococcota bacterium]|nr:hypothetical protein [Myxococcota bacterium]